MLAREFDYKWQVRDSRGYKLAGAYILRAGGDQIPYSPVSLPLFHREFAQIRTAAQALAFVEKYGFVTCEPSSNRESVAAILRASAEVRRARLRSGEVTGHLPILSVRIEQSAVKLAAHSLLDWLWICVAHDLAGELKFKRCEFCGTKIAIDTTDNRSATLKRFCGNACRLKSSRMERKGRKDSKQGKRGKK